jgi:hypothetical protein
MNILGLIACHTNNHIKYNVNLHNIHFIKKYVKDLIIIDTKEEIESQHLYNDIQKEKILHYFFIKNKCYFEKWVYALQCIDYKKYDFILFLQDNIILIYIEKYIDSIYSLKENINIFSYIDIIQNEFYLFLMKTKIIDKFIIFNISQQSKSKKDFSLQFIDTNIHFYIEIARYNKNKNIDNLLYHYLLDKNIFGIIELSKIIDTQNNYKIELYGYSIKDFDYHFYGSFYHDLFYLNKDELLKHFIENGQFEGRRYKKSIELFLHKSIRKKLNQINILYFFDVPNDFDIFYYKKNNYSLKDFSNKNTMLHYIQHGFMEGHIYNKTIYNKTNDKNIYINSFYLLFLNSIHSNADLDLNLNYHIMNQTYIKSLEKYIIEKQTKNHLLLLFDPYMYKLVYNNTMDNNTIIEKYLKEYKVNDYIYKIPYDFDCFIYRLIYDDMKDKLDEEIFIHYILHGYYEKRMYKLSDEFHLKKYREENKHLHNKTNIELIEYYIKNDAKILNKTLIKQDFNKTRL